MFLAIAVDNLADADALGENEAKEDEAAEQDNDAVVYEVRSIQHRRNYRGVWGNGYLTSETIGSWDRQCSVGTHWHSRKMLENA